VQATCGGNGEEWRWVQADGAIPAQRAVATIAVVVTAGPCMPFRSSPAIPPA